MLARLARFMSECCDHTHDHPCEHGHEEPPIDKAALFDSLVDRCRKAGLRRTFLLRQVLTRLVEQDSPVSVPVLQTDPEISKACDPATLYRLMERLESHQIVRRVGLHERAAHYYLNLPNRHRDFLVCIDCGSVEVLKLRCPVGAFDEEVSRETGFKGVYHELQFYGHCRACQG